MTDLKLYAISDLHLSHEINRRALQEIAKQKQDWLIVAGDLGEEEEQFHYAFKILTRRYKKVFWVPGNHDLWTLSADEARGEKKYLRLVSLCREYGVITPEDPYPIWDEGGSSPHIIIPLFLLYDYSFRPDEVSAEQAIPWAMEAGLFCRDEVVLGHSPYPSRTAWCSQRCDYTEKRLQETSKEYPWILINHYPFRYDLVELKKIPRFSIWCGTTRSENWHKEYPVSAAIYGHIHVRGTHFRDGIRFEEVSLGYPNHWEQEKGINHYLRQILPPV